MCASRRDRQPPSIHTGRRHRGNRTEAHCRSHSVIRGLTCRDRVIAQSEMAASGVRHGRESGVPFTCQGIGKRSAEAGDENHLLGIHDLCLPMALGFLAPSTNGFSPKKQAAAARNGYLIVRIHLRMSCLCFDVYCEPAAVRLVKGTGIIEVRSVRLDCLKRCRLVVTNLLGTIRITSGNSRPVGSCQCLRYHP